MTPEMNINDKLCTAMSIIQTHILAAETTTDPAAVFGVVFAMPTHGLEMANRLLVEILHDLPSEIGNMKTKDE